MTAAPRLVVDGRVLPVPVEVADSLLARSIGALGRRRITGALLLRPCSSVHGVGMRIDLDVAYLDRHSRVLEATRLRRWRVHLPRQRARAVLEADAGMLAGWGVLPGCTLGLAGPEGAVAPAVRR
jgi:hypothetical protein